MSQKKDLHSCCTDEDIEAILMVTERCEDPVHLMEVLCHSRSCVVIPLPQGLDLAVAVTAVVSYHVAAYCLTFPSLKVEG